MNAALSAADIPHAIVGGVAVCLHGYRRNTLGLDVLSRNGDQDAVRTALSRAGYEWPARHGVALKFILSGERAGKDSRVYWPAPHEPGVTAKIEGLAVLSLARLNEVKLACGLSSPRRTHRDLADVVELIAIHNLDSCFARSLHKSVQPAFRILISKARA